MNSLRKKPRFRLFNSLTLLFLIIIFFGFLSLVLSWANVKTRDSTGKTIPILGAGILEWFATVPLGLYNSVVISVFLFVFGSFIYLTIKTKALNAIFLKFLNLGNLSNNKFPTTPTNFWKRSWLEVKTMFKTTWIIVPLMLFMSLNGTFNGMGTSSLPFYAFVVPIFLAAGFDIWTAFLIVFLGAGSGVIGSTVNPFATIIATSTANDSIKEYSNLSSDVINLSYGMAWRWISWITLFTFSSLFVMFYAYRVKKNYHHSYFPDQFDYYRSAFSVESLKNEINAITKRKILIASVFFLSFFLMLFLVIPYDQITQSGTFKNLEANTFNNQSSGAWFHNFTVSSKMTAGGSSPSFQFGKWNLAALSMYFFIATILIGILARSSETQFIGTITEGCQKMIPAVLCIGLASGLSVLFAATNLKFLFINGIIDNVKKTGGNKAYTLPIMTYLFTIPVSLLIPSTSGLARAIFPLLGPAIHKIQIADGITNNSYLSSTVTAYTFGIGLGNLFAPTYAAVVVSTAFCKIKYNHFLKAIWRLLLFLFVLCLLLIVLGSAVNNLTSTSQISLF